MSAPSTWEEPSQPRADRSILLTYVLGYDDLLADRSWTVRVGDGVSTVVLGRGAGDEAPGLHSAGEICLPDRWASVHHAVLRRFDGFAVLDDEGSRNGTYVNGERITQRRLSDGDLIEIGHSLLCYRHVEAPRAALVFDESLPPLGPTRSRSPEIAALLRDIARIAPSEEAVLILGETGTGKEVVAATIHALSGRRGEFVPVDCGAIPEGLFESVFFGHRRGAFTGALEARTGEIARAHGGTLFLDEIGNLSASSQAKLLRALETGLVTPLGASEPIRVDVRRVAATNSDLYAEDAAFRSDLLQRVAGYVARLPPLRERREDLGALAAHLLREAGVRQASITAAAGRRLFAGPFPGNVRQLRAALRSASILADGGPIDLAHLAHLDAVEARPPAPPEPAASGAPPAVDEIDRAAVEAALAEAHGNVLHAARLLSTYPRQLYRWIARLGLKLEDYRR